jgi:hypothetical protein
MPCFLIIRRIHQATMRLRRRLKDSHHSSSTTKQECDDVYIRISIMVGEREREYCWGDARVVACFAFV